jgi:hypothetical protein
VGTEGVDVDVGGGVLVDKGVCVGTSVGGGGVLDGNTTTVGVSVAATFDGRLQASIAKTRAMIVNDIWDFIVAPFFFIIAPCGSAFVKTN